MLLKVCVTRCVLRDRSCISILSFNFALYPLISVLCLLIIPLSAVKISSYGVLSLNDKAQIPLKTPDLPLKPGKQI